MLNYKMYTIVVLLEATRSIWGVSEWLLSNAKWVMATTYIMMRTSCISARWCLLCTRLTGLVGLI
jgi:hypothetical protein